MSKSLSNFIFIMLFLAPSSSFGMESEPIAPLVKIQTSFEIELQVAKTSETLKHMIEDIGEEGEQSIPLPKISGQQFELLLLPAMQNLANLPMAELKESEEKLARQLQQIVADVKSNNQPLNNKQLIEFITGANYLNIPLVEPALNALAQRILNKDELLQLVALEDKLKDLWHMHPAMEMLSLQHLKVDGVIVSMDGNNLISWSWAEDTIKIWNKNKLREPITLKHPGVKGVIESSDGNYLISWSFENWTIKIWDKNTFRESITLQHLKVDGVIESMDGNYLISWSFENCTIKIWNKNNLREPITLNHFMVRGFIESRDGNYFISWAAGTIKIWDKTNLAAEPITLRHSWVSGIIKSKDRKKFISWSQTIGTIKIWDKNNFAAELITLPHLKVDDVIENMDGMNLISWSKEEGTIKIWDKTILAAEPITLQHQWVKGVIERSDRKNLISWGGGTIKIWGKNTFGELATLQHLYVSGVIESRDGNKFISWSKEEGTIKIWDKALLDPTPEQILLLLAVYFVSRSNQVFDLTTEKLAELKATFNTLPPITQTILEDQAPRFIAAIKSGRIYEEKRVSLFGGVMSSLRSIIISWNAGSNTRT